MNITQYGKELIKSGDLTWKRNARNYQHTLNFNFIMEWPAESYIFGTPQNEETIFYISANQTSYKSPLHFAWRTLFFYREFDNKPDLLETISESHFEEINIESALSIIWKSSQHWSINYKSLLPDASKAYLIWNDGMDTYLVLEDNVNYYAWNWLCTA